MFAAALLMFLAYLTTDFGLKAVWPNRLILEPEGLSLITAYGRQTWSWDQYAGLRGWWHLVLRVRLSTGTIKHIAIGHWQPDLDEQIAKYAAQFGIVVPRQPPNEDLSPAPLFVLAGLIAAAGALAAVIS